MAESMSVIYPDRSSGVLTKNSIYARVAVSRLLPSRESIEIQYDPVRRARSMTQVGQTNERFVRRILGCSGSDSFVAMVQAADLRDFNDPSLPDLLDRPADRRVLSQR